MTVGICPDHLAAIDELAGELKWSRGRVVRWLLSQMLTKGDFVNEDDA